MFGGSNLFQALSDDFMRDPFFQDPFRSAFSEAGFLEPSHVLTPFPASTVPQRRGREVHIESPRAPAGRATSVSIEEVHDGEPAHTSVHRPHIEEPDEEPQYSRMQQPVRHQAPPQSVMNLFTEPFSHPAFSGMFDGHVGGAPSNGNTFCYMSTAYAQQAPDGTQYTQTSSSAYGPTGVAEHQKGFKDGRTGEQEMTISRQMHDKGRTVTQRRHADGRQSQQQQLRNLADAEAETFDSEWKYEAQQSLPSYMRSHSVTLPQASRDRPPSALGW